MDELGYPVHYEGEIFHNEIGVIKDLIIKNRSYRRCEQRFVSSLGSMKGLVGLAQLGRPAMSNPEVYILSADSQKNAFIFQQSAWAGYLKEWPGSCEVEDPPRM